MPHHKTPDFARQWLDWEPHDGQVKWLAHKPVATNILHAGRRWGKSEGGIAVDVLADCVLRPWVGDQLICSVTIDQARLGFDTLVNFCYQTGLSALFAGKPKNTPFPTVKFKTGPMVTARSTARGGLYIRGHKYGKVRVDEADYVDPRVISEVIRMTLADNGGSLYLYTTPAAKRQLVYRLINESKSGDPAIYQQGGTTFDNPHVDAEYVNSLKAQMTEAQWLREIMGEYANDDTAVFRFDDIRVAYEKAEGANGLIPEPYIPGHRYVAGADLAKSADWTVVVVWDVTKKPYRRVAFYRWQLLPWPATIQKLRQIHQDYHLGGPLNAALDATGLGDVVLDELADLWDGIVFTAKWKVDAIMNFQVVLQNQEIILPFVQQEVDEMQAYEWDDKRLVQDCVMAEILAAWKATPPQEISYTSSPW